MNNDSNQALVGTDAIKAFLEKFKGVGDDELSRIIVEELLQHLMSRKNI